MLNYDEVVSNIKQLTWNERLSLLELITRSMRENYFTLLLMLPRLNKFGE